jgi:hypothetical protein
VLFDNTTHQRIRAQIEPPIDGELTRRTQRALKLLHCIDEAKIVRNHIRELYALQRRIDEERTRLIKKSEDYDV